MFLVPGIYTTEGEKNNNWQQSLQQATTDTNIQKIGN